jgi:predicted porin
VAGGFAQNNLYSAAAQYHAGSFSAAVAYMKINDPGANSGGALPTATTIFTGTSQQNIDAGFSYAFGSKATVSFAYSRTNLDNPTSNSFFSTQPAAGSQRSWKFDNFEVNAQYYIKPDVWLGAAYTYTQAHVDTVSGNSVPKWNQVALEADYDLSKLTSVYIQGAYQHANGNTGENFDFADMVGAPSHSSTDNQMLYRIAMIHHF